MKYFMDTEFIEDGKIIDLVSLALVAEDGRELYCEVDGVDWSKASPWVLANVKPHLWSQQADKSPYNQWSLAGRMHVGGLESRADIARHVRQFCDPEKYGKPEVWAYFASYDWVALCQLFGTMMELPKGWPMMCNDVKQECNRLGNPKLPPEGKDEHHALVDAKWTKTAWEFLQVRAQAATDV